MPLNTFLWPAHTRGRLHEILRNFIHALDHDFDPPLSARVRIDSYSWRLAERAEVLVAAEADLESPVGICAIYCNDQTSRHGYISYLGVAPSARHLKTGRNLVKESLEIAWSRGMRCVELHTTPNEPRLPRFYEQSGFVVIDDPKKSDRDRLLMRANRPEHVAGEANGH